MFNKKETKVEPDFDKFDTLIGENTNFVGDLNAKGSIRLDGRLKGKINIEGHLFIGENAVLEADIVTSSIIISGKVTGNIQAQGLVRITSRGKLDGDIVAKTLVIDEDAFFNGNCKMSNISTEVSE